jgi:hypothetical protein
LATLALVALAGGTDRAPALARRAARLSCRPLASGTARRYPNLNRPTNQPVKAENQFKITFRLNLIENYYKLNHLFLNLM